MLEAYSHQFGQVLQNGEGHSARHDAVIALFDQNHSKISEVYEGIQTNVSSTKELISQNHTSTLSSLEKISTVLEAHNAQSKEHCAEIIKVCGFLLRSLLFILPYRSPMTPNNTFPRGEISRDQISTSSCRISLRASWNFSAHTLSVPNHSVKGSLN